MVDLDRMIYGWGLGLIFGMGGIFLEASWWTLSGGLLVVFGIYIYELGQDSHKNNKTSGRKK